MVLSCSLEVAYRVISIAEIATGTFFSSPVADVLGNAKVFLVILYCSLEVAERVIRSFSWYFIARWKSPIE